MNFSDNIKSIYIIAEAGVNHNGSLELAKKLVDVAVTAGADAVKFQTFKAEKVVRRFTPKATYQINNMGSDESQLEMLKKLELDETSHRQLAHYCHQQNIDFLSTPFDIESADFLVNELKLKFLKIASGEITNAPLLLRMAQLGRPIILSTGMSTLEEVEVALGVLAFGYVLSENKPSLENFRKAYRSAAGKSALKSKVVLLHCTSEYPAPFEEVNLRAIHTMRDAFNLPVGLSDHTLGIAIPIAAAALGINVIEKHFTLDQSLNGPDHKASLEPSELRAMIRSVRQVERSLGSPQKSPTPSEMKNRLVARRSIVAARDIRRGKRFEEGDLTVKRPGTGVHPTEYWNLIGREATRDYLEDESITL